MSCDLAPDSAHGQAFPGGGAIQGRVGRRGGSKDIRCDPVPAAGFKIEPSVFLTQRSTTGLVLVISEKRPIGRS